MIRTHRASPIIGLVVALLLTGLAPAAAQDGATRHGDEVLGGGSDVGLFRGNAARTGEQPGPGPTGEPVLRWNFTPSPADWALYPPAVADGLVHLVFPSSYLSTLDAMTGEPLRLVDAEGAVYVPAAAGGLVFVNRDGLQAIDAATGDLVWHFAAPRQTALMVASSPAVVDGVVYFRAEDYRLVALDAASGAVRWQVAFDYVPHDPAVAADTVYLVAGEDGETRSAAVVALEAATGAERWRAPLTGPIESSPAVRDGLVFVTERETGLVALDAATGAERWRFVPDDKLASHPTVTDGLAFIGSYDGVLYAVDTATGEEIWRFAAAGKERRIPAPSVVDGVVYLGAEGLFALDAATGEELWHFATSSVGDAPVVANGLIYLTTRYDGLVVIGDA